jgi:hypothetical protein
MKLKYGDQLFPYCKSECIKRKRDECPGMRFRDAPLFETLQENPVLSTIVGGYHATHPPCSYYIKHMDELKDQDERDDPKDIMNRVRAYDEERKKKSSKAKPKRKICRCKK